jgi:hypothetical protein
MQTMPLYILISSNGHAASCISKKSEFGYKQDKGFHLSGTLLYIQWLVGALAPKRKANRAKSRLLASIQYKVKK